jgi:CBS-domain-containing membrane protein
MVADKLDAKSTKVEMIMTCKLVTCHAEDDLQKVVDAMSDNQLRRIPIMDDDNRILGLIAQADVVMHFDHPKKVAAMVKEISQSTNRK